MAGAVWIGTSGWVYPHWRGIFYPPGLPASADLRFYAEQFSTVEINRSFYRLPTRENFAAWREQTPPGFIFAVKASRYLTHMKMLRDAREPVDRLFTSLAGLGEKLGPVLFQFPPRWALNLERLRAFLPLLPPGGRYAFEFRNATWQTEEVYRLLSSHGRAVAFPDHPRLPRDWPVTADFVYVRMHWGQHGIGYTDAELQAWGERLAAFRAGGLDAYVYFNNDPGGHALADARRLRALLAV